VSFGKPKKQKETADVKALRERQIIDLAKLDEEQNTRIKSMFRSRMGGRAFRAPGATRMGTNTSGVTSGATSGAPSGVRPSFANLFHGLPFGGR